MEPAPSYGHREPVNNCDDASLRGGLSGFVCSFPIGSSMRAKVQTSIFSNAGLSFAVIFHLTCRSRIPRGRAHETACYFGSLNSRSAVTSWDLRALMARSSIALACSTVPSRAMCELTLGHADFCQEGNVRAIPQTCTIPNR